MERQIRSQGERYELSPPVVPCIRDGLRNVWGATDVRVGVPALEAMVLRGSDYWGGFFMESGSSKTILVFAASLRKI